MYVPYVFYKIHKKSVKTVRVNCLFTILGSAKPFTPISTKYFTPERGIFSCEILQTSYSENTTQLSFLSTSFVGYKLSLLKLNAKIQFFIQLKRLLVSEQPFSFFSTFQLFQSFELWKSLLE